MGPWILYIILAWQLGPLAPEEQRTVLLNFTNERECLSIARQVDDQVKQAQAAFHIKTIACVRCTDLLHDKSRCTAAGKKK